MLLHPVAGVLVLLAAVFGFFQVVFTVAAPATNLIETFFGRLGDLATDRLGDGVLADFIGTALVGGVGGVLVFLPQVVPFGDPQACADAVLDLVADDGQRLRLGRTGRETAVGELDWRYAAATFTDTLATWTTQG